VKAPRRDVDRSGASYLRGEPLGAAFHRQEKGLKLWDSNGSAATRGRPALTCTVRIGIVVALE